MYFKSFKFKVLIIDLKDACPTWNSRKFHTANLFIAIHVIYIGTCNLHIHREHESITHEHVTKIKKTQFLKHIAS